MSELTDMIDKMVAEKTFTLEGVEAIKKLRDRAAEQEGAITKLKELDEEHRRELARVRTELASAKEKNTYWAGREEAIAGREKVMSNVEKNGAVAEAVAAAYKDAMSIVFKPNMVRESVFRNRNEPLPPGGSYGQVMMSDNETSTREEGA